MIKRRFFVVLAVLAIPGYGIPRLAYAMTGSTTMEIVACPITWVLAAWVGYVMSPWIYGRR